MSDISEPKYNPKRKNLLLRKDRNESVSNIDFGMYDLTTYCDFKKEETLFDKILICENEERRIQHLNGKNLFFMPEQEELLESIKQEKRLIICAPTSFGKTLILKEYIYREKPKNVVFIVPTNALAHELERDFKTNSAFDNTYVIFDKSSSTEIDKSENLFFIGTQEKFAEVNYLFATIGLFVIDEAYKLQDGIDQQRGYMLCEAFLHSIDEKTEQIVLLTPNAKLLGFDRYSFVEKHIGFNAVDRLFHKIDKETFFETLYSQARQSKTILYCDSPGTMIKFAEKAIPLGLPDPSFVQFLEKEFHPEWSVVRLLKKGILTHHGLMPKFVQNRMGDLFINDSRYNLIIGTNSISEGINTPTKNLFFDPNCDFSKEDLLYKNTIGRAGRLGRFPIGHIYSTRDLGYLDETEVEIVLEMSKDDSLKELQDNLDEKVLNDFYKKWSIYDQECMDAIKALKIPLSKLERIFSVLMTDVDYSGLDQIPSMAQKVYREEYPEYYSWDDRIYIRGSLWDYYRPQRGARIQLGTYSEKINFFRSKSKKKKSDSAIIEGYMRFLYSNLEYKILPVMSVAKAIKKYQQDWPFGRNVRETVDEFFSDYNRTLYGFDTDGISESQMRILDSLREFGISLRDSAVDAEMLGEIETLLRVRYSTYDVTNAIKKLAKSSQRNGSIFSALASRYFL